MATQIFRLNRLKLEWLEWLSFNSKQYRLEACDKFIMAEYLDSFFGRFERKRTGVPRCEQERRRRPSTWTWSWTRTDAPGAAGKPPRVVPAATDSLNQSSLVRLQLRSISPSPSFSTPPLVQSRLPMNERLKPPCDFSEAENKKHPNVDANSWLTSAWETGGRGWKKGWTGV